MTHGFVIAYCNNVTGEGLKYLRNITHDVMIRGKYVTDEFLRNLTNITHNLDIGDCDLITDEGLKHLKNLK